MTHHVHNSLHLDLDFLLTDVLHKHAYICPITYYKSDVCVHDSISGSFGAENESHNRGGHPTGKASIYSASLGGLLDPFPQARHGTAGCRFSSNQRCCYVTSRLNFPLLSVVETRQRGGFLELRSYTSELFCNNEE